MSNQANIPSVPRSPALPPRVAQAIEAGKMVAQRPPGTASADPSPNLNRTASVTTPDLPDARVELHLDKASGLIVGRVIDRRTNKEIRQLPPESMVRLVAALKKELGPLVDIKA